MVIEQGMVEVILRVDLIMVIIREVMAVILEEVKEILEMIVEARMGTDTLF